MAHFHVSNVVVGNVYYQFELYNLFHSYLYTALLSKYKVESGDYTWNSLSLCEVSGSHIGEYEDGFLLGCCPCCLVVYWRLSGACCLWDVSKILPDYKVQ